VTREAAPVPFSLSSASAAEFILGVKLVVHNDVLLQEPAKAEVGEVMERMKELGILMGKGGLYGNVFRIKPPMCFSIADADFLVDAMDVAISEGL
jgi:alanine-glyoxylate transaminase/(R)-3-amino-2-methylpropionate-pyruvate transaminase